MTELQFHSTSSWLHNISEIKPGHSAILSENLFVFYGIHSIAIALIITSLISCCFVIISILWSQKNRWDFSDRFPLYLATVDGLWGVSHLTDHMVLITTHTYPGTTVATALSINLWFFLGYQQVMHAGLATYNYLKIVRRVSLKLGRGEWRLHVFCISSMGLSITIFYPIGSFGCSGYWCLQDLNSSAGLILGFYIATSSTVNAICVTMSYSSILKVVEEQKEAMSSYDSATNSTKPRKQTTATRCLNTFVLIAVGLYCPLAVAYWAFLIETVFGVVEPFTVLLIVIAANSSGWTNALGYFHNNRFKAKIEAEKKQYSAMQTLSSNVSS